MDVSSINNTISFYKGLLETNSVTKPVIKFKDIKADFFRSNICQPFERTTPEKQGVSSAKVLEFLKELREDSTLNMHNIMVLRNGKVIAEAAFESNDLSCWKMSFSACKSVVSIAIGILVDRNLLDINTPVLDFFPEYESPVLKAKMREITVKTLLTMSTGSTFNEFVCMTTDNWEKSFIKSAFSLKSGTSFNYNSMNTYMLSAIVTKVSGDSLSKFLDENLFKYLGIENYYFEKSPTGVEIGGWGLYILPEDFAKIGQLVMQKGVWNGRQIVSKQWLNTATDKQIITPGFCGDFNYGFQIWTGREENSFLFNGMFGQNVWGFKDNGILIVSNAGNKELFQQSNFYKIVKKYFSKKFPETLPQDKKENFKLKKYIYFLSSGDSMPHFIKKIKRKIINKRFYKATQIVGKEFISISDNTATVGLLPKILQVIQNNYSTGFKSIKLMELDGVLNMIYCENKSVFSIKLGIDEFLESEIYYYGEKYLVTSAIDSGINEDGNKVITIICNFLETFSTRKIKIIFKDKKIELTQFETPCSEFTLDDFNKIKSNVVKGKLLNAALSKINDEIIYNKFKKIFEPTVELIEI